MAVGHWLFGGTCFLCRGAARASLLCDGCAADLPELTGPRCPRCALPAPEDGPCGRCLANPPQFDGTVAALAYAFPADVLIHALKFRGELALAALLAERLAARLVALAPGAECLVPVPLAPERLRARGYNQSLEIARHVSRAAHVPLAVELCHRVRDTPAQTDLPWAERARNVRGAFASPGSLAGARVAVLDDVMTTGATLDAVAAALKQAGAASVVNWIVARTLPPV